MRTFHIYIYIIFTGTLVCTLCMDICMHIVINESNIYVCKHTHIWTYRTFSLMNRTNFMLL
uniref:Uncharacterized protein n=1 Tax=Anguilla anguilla TaxID=7936 RepID=A0A0E9STT7_ANGAN